MVTLPPPLRPSPSHTPHNTSTCRHQYSNLTPSRSHPPPSTPRCRLKQKRYQTNQLSLLNIITLVVLDSCHFSIHRGSTYWSPGYGIMLMAVARVSMIAFMADLWIVGYSIAFVVYGGALAREASPVTSRDGFSMGAVRNDLGYPERSCAVFTKHTSDTPGLGRRNGALIQGARQGKPLGLSFWLACTPFHAPPVFSSATLLPCGIRR